MLTYKNLYCSLVRSMSEAIDLYDEGKGILAREGLTISSFFMFILLSVPL